MKKVIKGHHEVTVLKNANISNHRRKPSWHDEGSVQFGVLLKIMPTHKHWNETALLHCLLH